MSTPPSFLPDDLLARLKQYDVTIVPSGRHQERQSTCECIPERTHGFDNSAHHHRQHRSQQLFGNFENINNIQDHNSRYAKTPSWYQSLDRRESMTSLSDTSTVMESAVGTKFPAKTEDQDMMFNEYRPLSQQKLQESTPRRNSRTEETISPFQFSSSGDRFRKVIYSKLTGHHTDIQPKPIKRLRFEDIPATFPNSFQSGFNRKRTFEHMTQGHDRGQILDDVTSADLPYIVHSSVKGQDSFQHTLCKGCDKEKGKYFSKCFSCIRNVSQYESNSQFTDENMSTISDHACQFSSSSKRCKTETINSTVEKADSGNYICACAAMKQDFVKMAARAYRNLRRRDATSSGFNQFLVEINTTNGLLRQTLIVLKKISEMCDHVVKIRLIHSFP